MDMVIKQDLKISEARIIIFLNQVDDNLRHSSGISTKLKMDYSYARKIIADMLDKQWIKKHQTGIRTIYFLTTKGEKLLTEANVIHEQTKEGQ